MGRNKMTTTDQLDNFDLTMDINTMYHVRLEIMYRRYIRYKQTIEKYYPLRKDIDKKEVTLVDFDSALRKVRASVTKEIEDSYKQLENTFKQSHARAMKEEKPVYFG